MIKKSNKNIVVILAAGKSTRMCGTSSKVFFKIGGMPMILWSIYTASKIVPLESIYLIVKKDMITPLRSLLKERGLCGPSFIVQNRYAGTAGALMCFRDYTCKNVSLKNSYLIILCADVPFIKKESIDHLLSCLKSFSFGILGFYCSKKNSYGRIICKKRNKAVATRIVEKFYKNRYFSFFKDVGLCNSGLLVCRAKDLFNLFDFLPMYHNKEYHITDIVRLGINRSYYTYVLKSDINECIGINNIEDAVLAQDIFHNNMCSLVIKNGGYIYDPRNVYFSYGFVPGFHVVIEPFVHLGLSVTIGNNTVIRSFSYISNSSIGNDNVIGPYAHMRSAVRTDDGCKIGSSELKNSCIGSSTKIPHFSYVGDAEIGSYVNIGAGSVICNYDGIRKNCTKIHDYAFIGSNTSLVAPLEIGDKSFLAAGSVINSDVPRNKLAIERNKMKIFNKKIF